MIARSYGLLRPMALVLPGRFVGFDRVPESRGNEPGEMAHIGCRDDHVVRDHRRCLPGEDGIGIEGQVMRLVYESESPKRPWWKLW